MDSSELLDMYARASDWTNEKVKGAVSDLDAPTPCEGWDVRTLLNHMLETQQFFVRSAKGQQASPPSPEPPELVGDDPVGDFDAARAETLRTFGRPGVIDQTGPTLGIAFSDQLLHGWDLAQASNQDATMPDGLPEAAFQMIHGRFTDEQRVGVFKPALPVPNDSPAQDKLLAYTGRDPTGPAAR
jgi:uncharacterized protein (TIGR03086 family)